jgi:hypothetical protein
MARRGAPPLHLLAGAVNDLFGLALAAGMIAFMKRSLWAVTVLAIGCGGFPEGEAIEQLFAACPEPEPGERACTVAEAMASSCTSCIVDTTTGAAICCAGAIPKPPPPPPPACPSLSSTVRACTAIEAQSEQEATGCAYSCVVEIQVGIAICCSP